MRLEYSRAKALYAIILPVLVLGAMALYFVFNPAEFPARLTTHPIGSLLVAIGLGAWIIFFWPMAISILSDGIDWVTIAPEGLVLGMGGTAREAGTVTSVVPRLAFPGHCRFEFSASKLAGSITMTNAMQKSRRDLSASELARCLQDSMRG